MDHRPASSMKIITLGLQGQRGEKKLITEYKKSWESNTTHWIKATLLCIKICQASSHTVRFHLFQQFTLVKWKWQMYRTKLNFKIKTTHALTTILTSLTRIYLERTMLVRLTSGTQIFHLYVPGCFLNFQLEKDRHFSTKSLPGLQ